MTNIDIFSGFLGAGKTTLIKKLIKESFAGQKVVLIENEFGEIGIDGGFLKESGIQINELNAGCICCSLVGDFRAALQQVVEQYHPDRIVIEPSGVGKLSDVTRAVEGVAEHLDVKLNSFVTVADVNKVKMYMKNFGEFYDDQISHASCIILSRTQTASEEKIAAAVAMLREKNPTATIVTTAWDSLTGEQILKAMSSKDDFKAELIAMAAKAAVSSLILYLNKGSVQNCVLYLAGGSLMAAGMIVLSGLMGNSSNKDLLETALVHYFENVLVVRSARDRSPGTARRSKSRCRR